MSALGLNAHTPVDASAAAVSMTLPTIGSAGDEISVEKYDTTSNAVVISGSIRGAASTITLTLPREAVMFRRDAQGSWWPIAGHKTLSSLQAAFAPSAVPAWVPGTSLGRFNPVTGDYNVNGLMMRTWRRARAAARAQAKIAELAFPGDSILIGWNGQSFTDAMSLPRQVAAGLARATGLPIVGSGIVPAVAGGSSTVPNSDRWTYTGQLGVGKDIDFGQYYPGVLTMTTSSTATYTTLDSGNKLQVFEYSGSNGGGPFTVAVNGTTLGTINPGSGTPITAGDTSNCTRMTTFTGLNITPGSTVKFTPTGNYPTILGLHVVGAGSYGIRVHNLGLGGTQVSAGGAAGNWNDTTMGNLGFARTRLAMLQLAGITPDITLPSIGNNDIFQGQPVANIVAGLASVRAMFSTFSSLRIQAYTDSTSANVAAYLGAMYKQADDFGTGLMDWQQRIGDRATAANNGDLGPDNFHPSFATMADFGQSIGQLLAA